jgi:hypothetical protein
LDHRVVIEGEKFVVEREPDLEVDFFFFFKILRKKIIFFCYHSYFESKSVKFLQRFLRFISTKKIEKKRKLIFIFKTTIFFFQGIRSVGICLLHSYGFEHHEILIGNICRAIGFDHICISSQLVPMIRLERRASTVSADAVSLM